MLKELVGYADELDIEIYDRIPPYLWQKPVHEALLRFYEPTRPCFINYIPTHEDIIHVPYMVDRVLLYDGRMLNIECSLKRPGHTPIFTIIRPGPGEIKWKLYDIYPFRSGKYCVGNDVLSEIIRGARLNDVQHGGKNV